MNFRHFTVARVGVGQCHYAQVQVVYIIELHMWGGQNCLIGEEQELIFMSELVMFFVSPYKILHRLLRVNTYKRGDGGTIAGYVRQFKLLLYCQQAHDVICI